MEKKEIQMRLNDNEFLHFVFIEEIMRPSH